jgi:hypothetical protein
MGAVGGMLVGTILGIFVIPVCNLPRLTRTLLAPVATSSNEDLS